jgi:hypothetical protein
MPAIQMRADRANGNGFEVYPWGRTGVDDAFDAGRLFARGGVCFLGECRLASTQAEIKPCAVNRCEHLLGGCLTKIRQPPHLRGATAREHFR